MHIYTYIHEYALVARCSCVVPMKFDECIQFPLVLKSYALWIFWVIYCIHLYTMCSTCVDCRTAGHFCHVGPSPTFTILTPHKETCCSRRYVILEVHTWLQSFGQAGVSSITRIHKALQAPVVERRSLIEFLQNSRMANMSFVLTCAMAQTPDVLWPLHVMGMANISLISARSFGAQRPASNAS